MFFTKNQEFLILLTSNEIWQMFIFSSPEFVKTFIKMKKSYTKSILPVILIFLSSVTIAQQNSLLFDGVDDKVTVPANALFNSANTLTVEAWINATQWKSQSFQGTIIGKDGTNQSGYVLRCGANGKLSFTVGNGGGVWTEVLSASLMQTNLWYHVAGVFDNGTMYIYITF